MNRRVFALAVLVLGLAALVAALPARAAGARAAPPVDYGPLLVAALEGHIQPRHAAFAAAAADLEEAARGFCAGDRPLADVRAAWHGAMDGWMGVQHIAFGPIQSYNRRYRVQFWPDKRNSAPAQIEALLAEERRDLFKPGGFTFASVAVQGLPVIERLAFAEAPPRGYACELMAGVAANVAEIAGDLRDAWGDDGDTWGREVRDAAAGGSDMLGLPHEVAGMLLGGLGGELKLIREYKLQAPLAGGAPESPLAERSLRNVALNLEVLSELYGLLFLPALRQADPKLAGLLERAFAQTRATAGRLPHSLVAARDAAAHRATLGTLVTEVGALRQLAAERAADRLGLVLGFNALDGD